MGNGARKFRKRQAEEKELRKEYMFYYVKNIVLDEYVKGMRKDNGEKGTDLEDLILELEGRKKMLEEGMSLKKFSKIKIIKKELLDFILEEVEDLKKENGDGLEVEILEGMIKNQKEEIDFEKD